MTEEKMKKEEGEISRREFIKGAGYVVGGVALGGAAIGAAVPAVASSPSAPKLQAGASSLMVMNPVGALTTQLQPAAKRLDTLEGKRIGLYIARRANAFEFMARVKENLKKQFPTATLLGGVEGTIWAKKEYDRPGPIEDLLKEKPDGVIMAMSS